MTGDSMKVYIGIDIAKDKFDYSAMDDALNILCSGSNKDNRNERFKELSACTLYAKHANMNLPLPFLQE